MKKYFILFCFVFTPLTYASSSVPKIVLNSKEKQITWKVNSLGEQVIEGIDLHERDNHSGMLQFLRDFVKENKIIITPEMVTIRYSSFDLNPCQYTYNYREILPNEYWESINPSKSFNRILSKYGVSPNDLVGIIESIEDNSGCRVDEKNFLLINDKIIFSYNGWWVFFSTIKNEPDPVVKKNQYCSSPEQTPEEIFEGAGYRTDCFYNGFSLLKAYDQYRLDYDIDYLENNIRLNENHIKEYAENGVSVEYKWISSNKLIIDQQFQGGSTNIIIEQELNGTKITSYGHPD